MIKKYNDKKNISGYFIKVEREKKHITRDELSRRLDLKGVNINRDELYLIETNQLMIKDFELVAISEILDIDLNNLKDYLED